MSSINGPKSNSTSKGVSLYGKIHEWVLHFGMRWRGRGSAARLAANLDKSVAEYEAIYAETTGRRLQEGRLFEVGFGARPLRMFWLTSLGFDVRGVDLDRPVLKGSPSEFSEMLRKNGLQRVMKSGVRHFIFDRSEWRGLDKELKSRKKSGLLIQPDRFLVADASTVDFHSLYSGGIDFVYSEDVFEHVPPQALDRLLENLAKGMSPRGCAIFRPHVYTSIGGGHLPEWYPHQTAHRLPGDSECRSEPWEHLRKRRFKANTYLNELRLADYRDKIGRYFEIVTEKNQDGELGRKFLTPDIKAELSLYTEEELLLNNVLFVCRPKK